MKETTSPESSTTTPQVARVYLRVSTQEQDLTRQRALIEQTRHQGYYIAGVYEEQASGANLKRPELQRLVNDIQPGDVIVAERMDRISRAPLPEAEALIATLQNKGAKLVVPGYVDLSEIQAEGMARVVLDTMQQMLLRMALQAAREDYELRRERQAQGIELAKQQGKYKGKQPDTALHNRVRVLPNRGMSIRQTAQIAQCAPSTVQRIKQQG